MERVFLRNDVDDATRTLRVVFGRRAGDHLHRFDHVGGELLQRIGHTGRYDRRRFVVDQHPDVAAAAQADVTIQIDGQQRYPAQYVRRVAPLAGQVFVGVEHQPVDFLLDQGFLTRYVHLVQNTYVGRQNNRTKGKIGVAVQFDGLRFPGSITDEGILKSVRTGCQFG